MCPNATKTIHRRSVRRSTMTSSKRRGTLLVMESALALATAVCIRVESIYMTILTQVLLRGLSVI